MLLGAHPLDLRGGFVDWLVGDEAQGLIKAFGVAEHGEPLFFPNAQRRTP